VLNTSGGDTIQVPKTTAHTDAAIVAEAGPIGDNDPTFGQTELGAYKYGRIIQVSRELLTDTGVDLEGYLAMSAGRALGNAFGAHAITGTGSGQPRGIITDATAGATGPTGAGGGFGSQSNAGEGADLLIDLFHSVIAPYRMSQSCRWMMSDTTAGAVRKIKTSEGQYIWQPSVIAGQPDTILGKPVLTDPNVPDIDNDNESVLFGDFSQYFGRLAGGIRFERSDEYAFGNDLVTFRAIMRADGALVDLTGAVKYFLTEHRTDGRTWLRSSPSAPSRPARPSGMPLACSVTTTAPVTGSPRPCRHSSWVGTRRCTHASTSTPSSPMATRWRPNCARCMPRTPRPRRSSTSPRAWRVCAAPMASTPPQW
jgi:hypothetical protein